MICTERPLISTNSGFKIAETVKQINCQWYSQQYVEEINLNRLESNSTELKQDQEHLERLLQQEQTLKNILLFLCSIPPESNLRLVLQLALIAEIPDEQLELLLVQLQSPRSLESLLLEANILTQILEADGKVEIPLENWLLEAMDLTGLVIPTSLSGTQFLLEELAKNLVHDIQIKG